MRRNLAFALFLLAVPCNGQNGKKKMDFPPECVPRIESGGILPSLKPPFKILPTETFKGAPSIQFEILEDGSVANARIIRSSGISDIDSKLFNSVSHSKYKARPPKRGVVEYVLTVTIDWY